MNNLTILERKPELILKGIYAETKKFPNFQIPYTEFKEHLLEDLQTLINKEN